MAFLAAYAAYVWKETRQDSAEAEGELEPLKFAPKAEHPRVSLAVLRSGTTGARVEIAEVDERFTAMPEAAGAGGR